MFSSFLFKRNTSAVVERGSLFPLSLAQKRLFFQTMAEQENCAYNVPFFIKLTGTLDVSLLEKSLEYLLERHGALRTVIKSTDHGPLQYISEEARPSLKKINLSSYDDSKTRFEKILSKETRKPVQVINGNLCNFLIVKTDEKEHYLIINIHHIIMDGLSRNIFSTELQKLYFQLQEGEKPSLPVLKYTYRDFVEWEGNIYSSIISKDSVQYWTENMKTIPPLVQIPGDGTDQGNNKVNLENIMMEIPEELSGSLKDLARSEGSSRFHVFLTAFYIFLNKYSFEEDIIIGCATSGRDQEITPGLIGLFTNTLPVKISCSPEWTFRKALEKTRSSFLEAREHELPFQKIVEIAKPHRSSVNMSLFNAAISMIRSQSSCESNGLTFEEPLHIPFSSGIDLLLRVYISENRLKVKFVFRETLFSRQMMERIMVHFVTLLKNIVHDPDKVLSELSMLPEPERLSMLVKSHESLCQNESPSILEHFENCCGSDPDSPCLRFMNKTVTYEELNDRTDRLAHYLIQEGIRPGIIVGLCLERSFEMVIAILATMKTGGAFLPMDPGFPKDRLEYLVNDAQAKVVLTQSKFEEILSHTDSLVVSLDSQWKDIERINRTFPEVATAPSDLAYIIYTSGSTGSPKGVMISHSSINNYMNWHNQYFNFTSRDRVLLKTPYTFDASLWEFFAPLMTGGLLIILEPEKEKDPGYLAKTLKESRISILNIVPSVLTLLLEEDDFRKSSSLSRVICGGEALNYSLLKKFGSIMDTDLYNIYGPTETTLAVTCWKGELSSTGRGTIPIGKPVANAGIMLADKNNEPVPWGVTGEILVEGPGLARGYLNDKIKTGERFLNIQFGQETRQFYKTGDMGKWLPDKNLKFMGRSDRQVKVRGLRIEPGEIESSLESLPGVKKAIVSVENNGLSGKRILAYVLPMEGVPGYSDKYLNLLREKLPSYMIPSDIVILKEIPLLPSGKVDLQKLPGPEKDQNGQTCIAPRDSIERKLALIWQKHLGTTRIGVRDNFFALGGHSLLAVKIFRDIQMKLGARLPLSILFTRGTIESIANEIKGIRPGQEWSSLVPIRTEGEKPPLFLVHQVDGNILSYKDIIEKLDPDQPVYGLQAIGLDNHQVPLTSVEEMSSHYIREIRKVQPGGPYCIAGHSFGGLIAFEMASRLQQQGESVPFLTLFDTRFSTNEKQDFLDHFDISKNFDRFYDKLRFHVRMVTARTCRKLGLKYPFIHKLLRATNKRALFLYTPSIFRGKIILFKALDSAVAKGMSLDWSGHVDGELQIIEVRGEHVRLISPPYVNEVAPIFNTLLRESHPVSDL